MWMFSTDICMAITNNFKTTSNANYLPVPTKAYYALYTLTMP